MHKYAVAAPFLVFVLFTHQINDIARPLLHCISSSTAYHNCPTMDLRTFLALVSTIMFSILPESGLATTNEPSITTLLSKAALDINLNLDHTAYAHKARNILDGYLRSDYINIWALRADYIALLIAFKSFLELVVESSPNTKTGVPDNCKIDDYTFDLCDQIIAADKLPFDTVRAAFRAESVSGTPASKC